MRTLHRFASLGAGALLAALGGVVGPAAASTAPGATPHAAAACTLTVSGPAYYYPTDAFTKPVGGKHTGDKVTSASSCATYSHGFHPLVTGQGTVWMYTIHLIHPSPPLPVVSRYTVAATTNVRTAPNPRYGTTISTKHAGDVVSSPWPRGYFPNNFAQVILSNGNTAWMPSTYLR